MILANKSYVKVYIQSQLKPNRLHICFLYSYLSNIISIVFIHVLIDFFNSSWRPTTPTNLQPRSDNSHARRPTRQLTKPPNRTIIERSKCRCASRNHPPSRAIPDATNHPRTGANLIRQRTNNLSDDPFSGTISDRSRTKYHTNATDYTANGQYCDTERSVATGADYEYVSGGAGATATGGGGDVAKCYGASGE